MRDDMKGCSRKIAANILFRIGCTVETSINIETALIAQILAINGRNVIKATILFKSVQFAFMINKINRFWPCIEIYVIHPIRSHQPRARHDRSCCRAHSITKLCCVVQIRESIAGLRVNCRIALHEAQNYEATKESFAPFLPLALKLFVEF